MESSTEIAHSRLLYADFLYDEVEEKEIISKITRFGFTAHPQRGDEPTKFSTENTDNFLGQLRSVCKSDSELLDYIEEVFFWIYRDGILPLKVAVVEIILKTDDLQELKKSDLEKKIWKLSLLLGSCFCEDPIPPADSSKDLRILKFSSKAIPNMALRNFVAEIVIEAETQFFDDLNKEIDSLDEEISIRNLTEQRIIEARDEGKIPASEVEKVISKATEQQEKKIGDIRANIITKEPISFLEGGFSYDQSIVRGYSNKMFIIGKIVQGSLKDSVPLYLSVLSMGKSQISSDSLKSMPVLQFPGIPSLLNFSYGAGQIVALQLLNSWNRHVEAVIREITTKQSPTQVTTDTDANKTLEELRDLIFHSGVNEKISVNYRSELKDLSNPSKKTFLVEFPMPPKEATPYSTNPEKYGLEKPGPIIANLSSLILEDLDLNEKHLLDAIGLRRSKIDALKIGEDRKYSKKMLCLTVVIAGATIVNVLLFLARIF